MSPRTPSARERRVAASLRERAWRAGGPAGRGATVSRRDRNRPRRRLPGAGRSARGSRAPEPGSAGSAAGDLADPPEASLAAHDGEQLVHRLRHGGAGQRDPDRLHGVAQLEAVGLRDAPSRTSRIRSRGPVRRRKRLERLGGELRFAPKTPVPASHQRLALRVQLCPASGRGEPPPARPACRMVRERAFTASMIGRQVAARRSRPSAPAGAQRAEQLRRGKRARGTGRSSTRAWWCRRPAAFFWMPSSVNSSIISASGRISRSLAGRPAEQREEVPHRGGEDALLLIVAHGGGAVALGELLAVRAQDHRHVREDRRLVARARGTARSASACSRCGRRRGSRG